MKTYSELILIPDFKERYNYLKLDGVVGEMNLEVHRWLNQRFYHTPEWRRVRRDILIRDDGLDLAFDGRPIFGRPIVHHINPITIEDVLRMDSKLYDPENLILVSHETHNAIHYGNQGNLAADPVIRKPGDTCLWKQKGIE